MTKSVQIKELEIGKGMPKICVPLTAVSETALCEEARNAKASETDLVEWRADFFTDLFDIPKTIEMLEKLKGILGEIPLLFTIRTKAEGGNIPVSSALYSEINCAVAASGKTDLIDVEVFGNGMEKAESCENVFKVCDAKKNLIKKLQEAGAKVIASSHDFEKTDAEEILLDRFKEMNKSGADILKMAVMPKYIEDVSAIMNATDIMRREYTERPLISMSMGEIGAVSRIEGEAFGSSVTFATVGAASAPGQIPIAVLREKMKDFHERI